MKERESWAWFAGMYVGCMSCRALAHRHPLASFVALCATGALFLGWLLRDNLQFEKEVAAQRQRLAERKAAVRAAKDAARRGRPDESRS
jgi:hypothetical protein